MNSESVSERSGLAPGDLILAVNGESVAEKTHKNAQDTIVRAGNRSRTNSLLIKLLTSDFSRDGTVRRRTGPNFGKG